MKMALLAQTPKRVVGHASAERFGHGRSLTSWKIGREMTYEMHKSRQLRDRAERLRAYADTDDVPRTAGMLREVATEYEDLATVFAAMDHANRGIQ